MDSQVSARIDQTGENLAVVLEFQQAPSPNLKEKLAIIFEVEPVHIPPP